MSVLSERTKASLRGLVRDSGSTPDWNAAPTEARPGLDVWMRTVVVVTGNAECCSGCRVGLDKSGLSITRSICVRQ